MKNKRKINALHNSASFSLFVTSYAPLFFLIIFKQVYENIQFLSWGGLNSASITIFIERFGLSTILLMIGVVGIYGTYKTLSNIHERAKNGFQVEITDLKNRNSEAINYIATYIIPFAFQSFDSWLDLISILTIIFIVYRIYISSSLILVNPMLSFKYGLFEIEYEENGKIRSAFLISRDKYISENQKVLLYEVGHKMYYSIKPKSK